MQTTVLSLLSLAALVAAVPHSAQVTPVPAANKRDAAQGTVTVVNSMSMALSTSIISNSGNPTLVAGGETLTGTMAPGATASMVMPVGWSGNMALALANSSSLASGSFPTLIEPSVWTWNTDTMLDIDVSDVIGYTVPVICRCNTDNKFLSGCVKDLWSLGSCDQEGEVWHADMGACQNPTNDGTRDWTTTTPFFEPCLNQSYTFPANDEANNGGDCKALDVTCCIGTEADGCQPPEVSSTAGASPSATAGAR